MKMEIDIEKWNRKAVYENFVAYTNPIFNITARLDVTKLVDYCKKNSRSFFKSFLFVVCKCLNQIEEFRLRIENGKVFLYDSIDPSYIIKQENGSIATCRTTFVDDYNVFCQTATEDMEKATKDTDRKTFNGEARLDLFYTSCMPWVDFIGVTNPYNFNKPNECSIPRLTWGKYSDINGKKMMTFDLSVHHALMDGEVVNKAFILIMQALEKVEEFLK